MIDLDVARATQIRVDPDPVLRQVAQAVEFPLSEDVGHLATVMSDFVLRTGGAVGLAAPQLGQSVRLIVVRQGGSLLTMLNPVIEQAQGKILSEELCYSTPNKKGKVWRAKKVQVTWWTLAGELRKGWFDGLTGRAIQHEVDHLDGVLFTDKLAAA